METMISDMILGALLLFLGRKLFWLFVGIVGFLVGMDYGVQLIMPADNLMVLLLALLCGIIGSVLVLIFEWAAIILAGFFGGGYLLTHIFSFAGNDSMSSLILFCIGGAVGMLIMALTFDWALIIVSSLIGAMLIVQHLNFSSELLKDVSYICGAALGILVQCLSLNDEPEEEPRPDSKTT